MRRRSRRLWAIASTQVARNSCTYAAITDEALAQLPEVGALGQQRLVRREHRLLLLADQQRDDGARKVLDETGAGLLDGVLLYDGRLGVLDRALFERRLVARELHLDVAAATRRCQDLNLDGGGVVAHAHALAVGVRHHFGGVLFGDRVGWFGVVGSDALTGAGGNWALHKAL